MNPENHFALNPITPQAAGIEQLWWFFNAITITVYLIVIAVLIVVLIRARRKPEGDPVAVAQSTDRRSHVLIAAAVGVTVITLIALLGGEILMARALQDVRGTPLRIKVTGHQWWWELEYEDPTPSQRLLTANELHIPVGRPIQLVLTSQDVIHSFWVPNLQGKKDLIPGRQTTLSFVARKPGTYAGQCAEFCGYQHAKMRLIVHADPPDRFDAWKAQQLRPARAPATDAERRGQQVFLSKSCILCHSIRGTPAGGTVAPDLTHLASRQTIATGALPNEPGQLAAWIIDPQSFKPGVNMPANALTGKELTDLLAYLTSLK